MRIREHHGFGHGLRPGDDWDMNCPSCKAEREAGKTPVITEDGWAGPGFTRKNDESSDAPDSV